MPLAIQDISEITDYISDVLTAPQAAYDLITKINEAIEPLERFAFAFPAYKDAAFAKLGYRIRPVGNYLLFYVVEAISASISPMVFR